MEKYNEWLSVVEVENSTGIPNATIRRYIRNHGQYLKTKKMGKSYEISSDTLIILNNIREQYNIGKDKEQVDRYLSEKGIPMTITVHDHEKEITINIGEALIDLKNQMNEQMNAQSKQFDEQMKFNEELVKVIKQQQEYIDNKLEERDRRLLESIRSIQDTRKEIAVSEDIEKKWYQFWK